MTLSKSLLSALIVLQVSVAQAFTLGGLFGSEESTERKDAAPSKPVEEPPTGLAEIALRAGRTADFGQFVPVTPQTLWVPSRYSTTQKNTLYIRGKRFVAEDNGEAVGFIPAGDGNYLVAVWFKTLNVSQPVSDPVSTPLFNPEELAKLPPELRLRALEAMRQTSTQPQAMVKSSGKEPGVVVYRVSKTGDQIGVVLVQPGVMREPYITRDAMYFCKRSKYGNTQISLNSYWGVNSKGDQLSGPQEAFAAFPTPNGDWMAGNIERLDRGSKGLEAVVRWGRENNGMRAVTDKVTTFILRDYPEFVQTSNIVVDAAPISDSVRTGHTVLVQGLFNIIDKEGGRDWTAAIMDVHAMDTKLSFELLRNIYGRDMNEANKVAIDLVDRMGLIEFDNTLQVLSQFNIPKVSGTSYGILSINDKRVANAKPIFQIRSTMSNLLGSIFTRKGDPSLIGAALTHLNDALVIRTPTGTVIVGAVPYLNGASYAAYAPSKDTVLAIDPVKQFVLQNGLSVR